MIPDEIVFNAVRWVRKPEAACHCYRAVAPSRAAVHFAHIDRRFGLGVILDELARLSAALNNTAAQ